MKYKSYFHITLLVSVLLHNNVYALEGDPFEQNLDNQGENPGDPEGNGDTPPSDALPYKEHEHDTDNPSPKDPNPSDNPSVSAPTDQFPSVSPSQPPQYNNPGVVVPNDGTIQQALQDAAQQVSLVKFQIPEIEEPENNSVRFIESKFQPESVWSRIKSLFFKDYRGKVDFLKTYVDVFKKDRDPELTKEINTLNDKKTLNAQDKKEILRLYNRYSKIRQITNLKDAYADIAKKISNALPKDASGDTDITLSMTQDGIQVSSGSKVISKVILTPMEHLVLESMWGASKKTIAGKHYTLKDLLSSTEQDSKLKTIRNGVNPSELAIKTFNVLRVPSENERELVNITLRNNTIKVLALTERSQPSLSNPELVHFFKSLFSEIGREVDSVWFNRNRLINFLQGKMTLAQFLKDIEGPVDLPANMIQQPVEAQRLSAPKKQPEAFVARKPAPDLTPLKTNRAPNLVILAKDRTEYEPLSALINRIENNSHDNANMDLDNLSITVYDAQIKLNLGRMEQPVMKDGKVSYSGMLRDLLGFKPGKIPPTGIEIPRKLLVDFLEGKITQNQFKEKVMNPQQQKADVASDQMPANKPSDQEDSGLLTQPNPKIQELLTQPIKNKSEGQVVREELLKATIKDVAFLENPLENLFNKKNLKEETIVKVSWDNNAQPTLVLGDNNGEIGDNSVRVKIDSSNASRFNRLFIQENGNEIRQRNSGIDVTLNAQSLRDFLDGNITWGKVRFGNSGGNSSEK